MSQWVLFMIIMKFDPMRKSIRPRKHINVDLIGFFAGLLTKDLATQTNDYILLFLI